MHRPAEQNDAPVNVKGRNADPGHDREGSVGLEDKLLESDFGRCVVMGGRHEPGWVMPKTWTAKFSRCVKSSFRHRHTRSLVAAYLVLLLFGITAGIVRWGLSASPRTALIIAVIVVSPFLFVWLDTRITSVKALGIEVSLQQVTVRVDADVSGAVMVIANTGGSGSPELLDAFQAIIQSNSRLMQIDLRDENYWWSTRLFLVAVLAFEYTSVDQLVFTRHLDEFVGMASPGTVRRHLAVRFPQYDRMYRQMQGNLAQGEIEDERGVLRRILMGAWSDKFQWREHEVMEVVTSRLLTSWLGHDLDTRALESGPLTPLLQFQIISHSAPFTALTSSGRLAHVVDRTEVAKRVAEGALRFQLA